MQLSLETPSDLLKGLQILRSVGEAIPAGGILKAVAGIGIVVLETAETIRANKKECSDIAKRAAQDILMLTSQLTSNSDKDAPLSDDLRDRLEGYLQVLQEVSLTVTRLSTESRLKRTLRSASIQEDAKDCLNKLNEAYQAYVLQFSIATDTKLTALVREMRSLNSKLELTIAMNRDEPDEIPRIPMQQIKFGEEISRAEEKAYILRVEHGKIQAPARSLRAVILRRFEAKSEKANECHGFHDFKSEIRFRGDLLHRNFARMVGVATSTTGRTKIIILEGGTVVAYDHLQSLSGLDYLLEHLRITCELIAAYRFLQEHRGSWRGGFREILLSARDKRLCIGGAGRIDVQYSDSSWRLEEAFVRLRDGADRTGGGGLSFEDYAHRFLRARELMTKWSEENTEQNARHLCTVLWLWSACSRSDQETEGSPGPAVAYIGWVEEKVWHGNRDAIPILHPHQGIPAVYPPEYFLSAFRQCDDKRERIVGTQYRGYTRWRTDISPGQTIHLQMMSCSFCTDRMSDSFHASTSPLSRDFGVEVDSLRLVSRVTFSVLTSITLLEGCSTTVYYFAHPPKPDGSLPDPPGFWSYSPEPLADASLEAGSAEVNFSNVTSNVRYHKLDPAVHHLLQDFESQGFLLVSEINRAFGLPFCTTRPVPERQETSFNQSLRHRLRTNRVSARFKYKKRDKLSL